MLRDLQLKPIYNRHSTPNLIQDLFIPTLACATQYDRTTYTFSPQALLIAAAGLAGLINNGGQMRLICHHQLPQDVLQAILDGTQSPQDALTQSLNTPFIQVSEHQLAELHHLKLLTWLVKHNKLHIKVAIPRHPQGIFHRKTGILTDPTGDTIAFEGSINESVFGWLYNDEQLTILNSWEHPHHIHQITNDFQKLWQNQSTSSIVIPIPEAIRQNLLDLAPTGNPALINPPAIHEDTAKYNTLRDRRNRLWQAIAHAIAHDPQTTIETIAADLWPHQLSFWRRYAITNPSLPRVLIADEVGLGKTIQAGAALKTFINNRKANKILILTPAVARWQWQQELRHKFNIEAPVLNRSGSRLELVSSNGDKQLATTTPWRQTPRLILSYDWLRRNATRFFDDAPEYDMVIFDEAHHARYLDVANPQKRRDNSYLKMLKGISQITQGLMLLTATPMQIDPAELWALLQTLSPSNQWTEAEFRRFYDVNNTPQSLSEWDTARNLYSRSDILNSPEQAAELARMSLPEAKQHLQYINMSSNDAVILHRQMTSDRIRQSMIFMRRTSSIKRSVSRHTRNLLRHYAQQGILKQSVPQRKISIISVHMTPEERSLYDDIDDFVKQCYQSRANVNRQALGFVMTHFRLRLGSSLYAFHRSIEDLQSRLTTDAPDTPQWQDLPNPDEDEYSDIDPDTAPPLPAPSSNTHAILTDMLARCAAQTGTDSKFTSLLSHLKSLHADGYRKVMVFSQFRDTQLWLRYQLAKEMGGRLLAGLSGSEDWMYHPQQRAFTTTARRDVVGQFRTQPEGILLCTETAAESLNFQFCSAIINYDIPWNPMRLEQRIGRIDRIGQEKSVIRIAHLFYHDTVEYDAYTAMQDRINDFQQNVGILQPILDANLEHIIRESVMDGNPSKTVAERVRNLTPSIGFDLDDLTAAASHQPHPDPILNRQHLSHILNNPEWLPDGYYVTPQGNNHWRITTPDGKSHPVTTDRTAHDYAYGTVDFFGPGSPAFPDTTSLISDDASSLPMDIDTILNEP